MTVDDLAASEAIDIVRIYIVIPEWLIARADVTS